MDEEDGIASEPRSPELQTPIVSRSLAPGADGARIGGPAGRGELRPAPTEPKQLKIVVRVAPAETQPGSTGYQPVPSGDSPGGREETLQGESDASSDASAPVIPVGWTPTSAGESPRHPL